MAASIEDSVLAGAHEFWRSVGLGQLLQSLDATGLGIVDNQKTSLVERRKLAEKTKEFRAVADDQKLEAFKPLLRAYQGEIDALTKRMKYAENEFLRLFKTLSEAPDPAPFLAGLVDERRRRGADDGAKAESERLRARCSALEAENRQLREQDRGREGLEQRAKQLEASMDALVAQRERELRDQTDALVQHLRGRESDLQQQLSAATRRLAQLDSEESERLARPADRDLVGRLAELEIVQSDLDHANARVADLQTQNAKLRGDLAQLAGDAAEGASVADALADYRRQIRELSEETKRLFDGLEKADADAALQRTQHEARAAAADAALQAKDDELLRVRREIARCADYDEVRRELDVMKSVEFSVGGWGLDADSAEAAAEPESLERLLARRNKELENGLVGAKTQLADSDARAQQLDTRVQALEAALEQKRALAERLEADLLSVGGGGGGGSSRDAGGEPADAVELQPVGGSGGVLEIVTGQRDRFRQRNMELEDEMRAHAAAVAELQRQAAQSKQDNLRLYEEIKYLRSYAAGGPSSQRDTAVVSIPQSKFSRGVDMDSVDAKYKNVYEESLNPFDAFRRRETSRRVRSMALFDRLIYMFSSFVAANRRARIAMLVYAALLHLLVVGALYRAVLAADDSPRERGPA
ncbi:hypothetical protein H4R21_000965 [Coemansia helicoidea]|uniref:Uncharacterized protein n=1 Tax=Coemansia helicoidea TaxID=1286919 RepID=A0ACC1LDS2_9FUNG|nr:hypothetical protein H4R21_000965 [Coemansia helicoidea]